jgi:hypothetical protein
MNLTHFDYHLQIDNLFDFDIYDENLICNDLFNNSMSSEQSSKTAEGISKWKCEICGKMFDDADMLNYHKLLEHSEHKRPPIGIG